jgi:hypothetical protein
MRRLGYKIGLVTNGKVFQKALISVGDSITWMRVSSASTRIGPVAERAIQAASLFPTTDLGISYTVTSDLDMSDARLAAEAARDTSNITHVRFVHDLTDTEASNPNLKAAEKELGAISSKLIFQQRDQWTGGQTPCRLGLLKPIIGADGYVYPCCGIQYAEIPGTIPWTMPPEARMCYWDEFENIQPFDGAQCRRCYYDDYNKVLDLMTAKVGHGDFI